MNLISKMGLIIIVASISTLSGEIISAFRGTATIPSSMPSMNVRPEVYEIQYTYLNSYDYNIMISAGRAVKLIIIPLCQIVQQNSLEEHAVYSAIIERLEGISFKPERRGTYFLIFKAANSEASVSMNIYGSRTFEWGFFWDSMRVAVVGTIIFLAGLIYEKIYGRGRR
jgi:hypothetical protein